MSRRWFRQSNADSQQIPFAKMKKLVLASESPRRRAMLKSLGIQFAAVHSAFREPAYTRQHTPAAFVQQNARGKALAVAGRFKNALVIGADTVVVYRHKVLGKPSSLQEAFEYMQLLQGKTHAVYTGICLMDTADGTLIKGCEKTLVTFRRLTVAEIKCYLRCINPLDKAGAYAIQDEGALIVREIRGCYYNVVGFPVARLEQMLVKKGGSLFEYMKVNQWKSSMSIPRRTQINAH